MKNFDKIVSQTDLKHRQKRVVTKNFEPWHKPRKQYMREFQWKESIVKFLQKYRPDSGMPLKYLTLPGKDFLDIRYLHQEVCLKENIELSALGFNNYAREDNEIHIIESEVADLEKIKSTLKVKKDQFEEIGNQNSMAFHNVKEFGDFDVVNLDLCDSVGTKLENSNSNYFEAIYTLVEHQKLVRMNPWLLFITTKANKEKVADDYLEKLTKSLDDNIKTNDIFRALLVNNDHWYENYHGYDSELKNKLTRFQFTKYFSLSLSKWLLQCLIQGDISVKIENIYYYSVLHGTRDMVSIVFFIQKVDTRPIQDKTGLVSSQKSIVSLDEKKLANALLEKVYQMFDLDNFLKENVAEFNRIVNECSTLMSLAGYPEAKYKEWVEKGCPKDFYFSI